MSRLKSIAKGLKDGAKNRVKKVFDSDGVDSGGKVVTKFRDIGIGAQNKYEESGAKGKVDAVKGHFSTTFDEISGQAMYQLVQERLAEQDRFNDLLAAKLQEALERISELEKLLADK